MVRVRRVAELSRGLRADAVVVHEFSHGVDAAAVAACDQFGVDAWAAVTTLDIGVDAADQHDQGVPALLREAGRAFAPGVVAGGRNLKRVAHQTDGPAA